MSQRVVSGLCNSALDFGCELRNYPGMDINLPALLKAKGLRSADLARKLKINKATVTRWAQGCVPLGRVFEVERETGIPAEQLRPDFFGERQ